jgi:hypothetical protein
VLREAAPRVARQLDPSVRGPESSLSSPGITSGANDVGSCGVSIGAISSSFAGGWALRWIENLERVATASSSLPSLALEKSNFSISDNWVESVLNLSLRLSSLESTF